MSRSLAIAFLVLAGVAFGAEPPASLTVPVPYTLTFSWNPVTLYTGGTGLPASPYYKLYDMTSAVPNLIQWVLPGNTKATRSLTAAGTYCYALSAEIYDGTPNGNEGAKTSTFCVTASTSATAPVQTPGAPATPICVQ